MSIFKTQAEVPSEKSKDVVRAALAEPQDDHFAPLPGQHKYPHSVVHAPSPKIGKS